MNKTILLKIIAAGLKGEIITLPEESEALEKLTKEHSISAYLYQVSKDDKYKKFYLGSALINSAMDKEMEKITSCFSKQDIEHVVMKGFYLKSFYPNPNLRVMGDVDILIQPSKIKQVSKYMKELGFKLISKDSHHWEFCKGKMHVEIHHSLVGNESPYYKCFSHPFDNVEKLAGSTYFFQPNYHLKFVLAHYAKHLYVGGGAGIRPLCDVYVILNSFDIDFKKLEEDLKELHLFDFWQTILTALFVIFDYQKISFVKNEHINDFLQFTLDSGIHGFALENNQFQHQVVARGGKIKIIFSRWFIPIKSIQGIYPWSKMVILLPFAYICRFFSLMVKKSNRLKELASLDKNEIKKTKEFYQKIGL